MGDAAPFLIAGGLSLVLFLALVYHYFRAKHLLDEMWAVDTYTARELSQMCSGNFKATVEVEGKVSCDNPIASLVSEIPCCWCRTKVERQERRVRTDKHGTHTDYVWVNAMDRTDTTIFKVTDETGYTLIDPTNSKIDAEDPHVIITSHREPWFGSIGFSDTGDYRITEELFLPTGYAYVLGQASPCQEGTSPDVLIHYPDQGYMNPKKRFFIISRKNEKDLAKSHETTVKVCFWVSILALISVAFCAWMLFGVLHWHP